jgi:octaprenyl-diphosphate synthase
MTLPLIHALEQAPTAQRKHIINLVKNHNEDPQKVAEVIDFVRNSGGLAYAQKAMYEYRDAAFEILHTFPESEVRSCLEELIIYVTERKK